MGEKQPPDGFFDLSARKYPVLVCRSPLPVSLLGKSLMYPRQMDKGRYNNEATG
jgi:hypothetical protein